MRMRRGREGLLAVPIVRPKVPLRRLAYRYHPGEGSMARTMTVLVVDFDEEMRHLVRSILEQEEYRIVEAASMHETLQAVRTGAPDLVILPTDFLLSQGGWMLGARVWEVCETVPIVFVKGWYEPTLVPAKAGPHAVLTRPVKSAKLLEAVKHALALGGKQ